ncbi:MAG: DUF3800 domain-containing protein [Acidobacteriia bacterium]|nr:DUF3800 domain-containing protein [Terriglobia bacterium]
MIEHAIMEAAFPKSLRSEKRLVMILEAYLDESGIDHGSKVVSVGALLATQGHWEAFSRVWRQALAEWGIREFKMADFVNGAGEFKGWSKIEKRRRFSRVVEMIKTHDVAAFGVMLPTKPYFSLAKEGLPRTLKDAYQVAALVCMAKVVSHLVQQPREVEIAYLLDGGAPGHGELDAVLHRIQLAPHERAAYRMASYTFASSERFCPIQAADILAHELGEHWERLHAHAPVTALERDYFKEVSTILHAPWEVVSVRNLRQYDDAYSRRKSGRRGEKRQ